MKLSVVMLQHGMSDMTRVALDSIFDSALLPEETIVVDNGSESQDDKDWITADKRLKPIFLPANCGYVIGTNRGWRVAAGDYILLCNNDIALSRSCIPRLVTMMDSDEQIGWISAAYQPGPWLSCSTLFPQSVLCELENSGGRERAELNEFASMLSDDSIPHFCEATESTVVLVRKSVSDEVGLFWEELHYHHTHDYGIRLKANGYKMAVCENAIFWHNHAHPTLSRVKNINFELERERSTSLMNAKYGNAWRSVKI